MPVPRMRNQVFQTGQPATTVSFDLYSLRTCRVALSDGSSAKHDSATLFSRLVPFSFTYPHLWVELLFPCDAAQLATMIAVARSTLPRSIYPMMSAR